MFIEKLIIITAPLRRALKMISASETFLQDPYKLLTILSLDDVLKYYAINYVFVNGIDKPEKYHPLICGIVRITTYTNGIRNSFNTEAWRKFLSELDTDVNNYIQAAQRQLYTELVGYKESETDEMNIVYAPVVSVAPNDYVYINIVSQSPDVFDSTKTEFLLVDSIVKAFAKLTAKTTDYFQLYTRYCSLVAAEELIKRRMYQS